MSRKFLQQIILVFTDCISLVVAFFLSLLITFKYHNFSVVSFSGFSSFFNPGVSKFLGLIVIAIFWYQEHYIKRRPFWEEFLQVVKTIGFILLINFGVILILGKGSYKVLVVSFWVLMIFIIPFSRILSKKVMDKFGLWQRDLFILGYGESAIAAYKLFARNSWIGYNLCGFVDIFNNNVVNYGHLPVSLINEHDLLLKIQNNYDCDIIVAISGVELNQKIRLINYLQHECTSLLILPDLSGLAFYGAEIEHFFGNEQLILRMSTNLSKRFNKIIKRVFDVIVGLFILLLISPILLIIALIIKLTTGSNVFFMHKRVGKNGNMFPCLKFQTMYPNSQELLAQMLASDPVIKDEWESCFKLKDDPRVTPIGKFLRSSSLDELPQIFNVLIGQMSLVGPRPIVLQEVERYKDDFYYYKMVLPGITGLWQVSGRSDVDYENRVRLDEFYVRNWSLWYDIVILFKTFGVVLKRTGAY